MALTKVTYSMIAGSPVNIVDFGAVGDGVTNDTLAIQNAIDFAETNQLPLYIPEQTFVVTALTVSNPLKIYGQGTLQRLTGLNSAIISVSSGNVEIDGLTILGPEANTKIAVTNQPERGIEVMGVDTPSQLSNIVVKNCIVNGVAGMGIWVQYAENVLIENNNVSYCGYAGIQFLSVIHGIVTKNRVDNIDSVTSGSPNWYGISLSRNPSVNLSTSARCTNCIVSENIVSNVPQWTGIDAHSGFKSSFINNNIYYCAYGIVLQYDSSTQAFPSGVEEFIVSGNTIEGAANIADNRSGIACIGLPATKNKNIQISNNILEGCGSYTDTLGAIYVNDTDASIVSENQMISCVRHGIGLNGACNNLLIKHNIVNGVVDGNLLNNRSYMYVQMASLTNCLLQSNRFYNLTGTSLANPVYGIWYTGSSATFVGDKNRMANLTGTAFLFNGVSGVYSDMSWELEQETVNISYTATGGAATETLPSQVSLFRRTPTTTGTPPFRISVTSNGGPAAVLARGSVGNIYIPQIYTVDGTNIGASIVTTLVYTIQGVYWTD
jgi:parallel beta-helix repeat protein